MTNPQLPEFDLPEGYDLDKEPGAAYRIRTDDGHGPLSGRAYVVARLNGEHEAGRIPVASSSRCQHGMSICDGGYPDGQLCADSWQYDYSIIWSRTQAGRKLINKLGIEHDKYQNPDHAANKFDREIKQRMEAAYAKAAAEREADNENIRKGPQA